MSAMSPGSAARTTGLVNTSRAAATMARTSPTMSPSGVVSAVGADGERGLVDQFGLARPPAVQRGLGGARPLGDRGHREIRVADFDEQVRRRRQYGSVDARVAWASRRSGSRQRHPRLLS